jgi:hypothetical protein
MPARFRLRSLVTLIALVALALAVVAVSVENRRLRKEIQAAQRENVLFFNYGSLHLTGRALIIGREPARSGRPTQSPNGLDGFGRTAED